MLCIVLNISYRCGGQKQQVLYPREMKAEMEGGRSGQKDHRDVGKVLDGRNITTCHTAQTNSRNGLNYDNINKTTTTTS